MKFATAMIVAALSTGTAWASGYVGVYALIDKVVMEPNDQNPQTIQIFGVFSIKTPDDRGTFQAPQRGYLYYSLPAGNRDLVLREWADLKAAAGTRTVIAFGGSSFNGPANRPPRLRKANEKAQTPDPYETGAGLSKMRSDTDYAPVKALLDFK